MPVADQMAVIEDLWAHEASMYSNAAGNSGEDRIQALEHCDALIDAWLDLSKKLGSVALPPPPACA